MGNSDTDTGQSTNELLRSYGKLKGLTQEKVAELLDISQQQYQKYERGETNMSIEMLKKISAVLEMPPACFFPGDHADLVKRIEKESLKYKEIIEILDEYPAMIEALKYFGREPAPLKGIDMKKLFSKISLINSGKKKMVMSIVSSKYLLISDEEGIRKFKNKFKLKY